MKNRIKCIISTQLLCNLRNVFNFNQHNHFSSVNFIFIKLDRQYLLMICDYRCVEMLNGKFGWISVKNIFQGSLFGHWFSCGFVFRSNENVDLEKRHVGIFMSARIMWILYGCQFGGAAERADFTEFLLILTLEDIKRVTGSLTGPCHQWKHSRANGQITEEPYQIEGEVFWFDSVLRVRLKDW